jgi:hypothetical protein
MGFSMTMLENEVLWQSYLLLGDNTKFLQGWDEE